jgi:hypothetical protein
MLREITGYTLRKLWNARRVTMQVYCDTGYWHTLHDDCAFLCVYFTDKARRLTGRYKARALRLAERFGREATYCYYFIMDVYEKASH